MVWDVQDDASSTPLMNEDLTADRHRFIPFNWISSVARDDFDGVWPRGAVSSERGDNPADYLVNPLPWLSYEGGGHIWIDSGSAGPGDSWAEFAPNNTFDIDEDGIGTTAVALTTGHYATPRAWATQLQADILASGVTNTYSVEYLDEFTTEATFQFRIARTAGSAGWRADSSQTTPNFNLMMGSFDTTTYEVTKTASKIVYESEEYIVFALDNPLFINSALMNSVANAIRWAVFSGQNCIGYNSEASAGRAPKLDLVFFNTKGTELVKPLAADLYDTHFPICLTPGDGGHLGTHEGVSKVMSILGSSSTFSRYLVSDLGAITFEEGKRTRKRVIDSGSMYSYVVLRMVGGGFGRIRMNNLILGVGLAFANNFDVNYQMGGVQRTLVNERNNTTFFIEGQREAHMRWSRGLNAVDHLHHDLVLARGINITTTARGVPISTAQPGGDSVGWMVFLDPLQYQTLSDDNTMQTTAMTSLGITSTAGVYARGTMYGKLFPGLTREIRASGERFSLTGTKMIEAPWT